MTKENGVKHNYWEGDFDKLASGIKMVTDIIK